MAKEKARATRTRATKATDEAAAAKAAPKRRTRKRVERSADDVAVLAYLLWERGEPGDATEHWLRAERELAA
jgi:Protein of unknown function (DUF2934)